MRMSIAQKINILLPLFLLAVSGLLAPSAEAAAKMEWIKTYDAINGTQLQYIGGMAVDQDGNMYISNMMSNKILVTDSNGNFIRELNIPSIGDLAVHGDFLYVFRASKINIFDIKDNFAQVDSIHFYNPEFRKYPLIN